MRPQNRPFTGRLKLSGFTPSSFRTTETTCTYFGCEIFMFLW